MDCSLLLPSSTVFKGSNLIDRIRQSCIDLQYKSVDENEIEQLLIESLTYFEKDITNDISRELFSLIGYCIKHLTNELIPFINMILKKSRTNANYIIITAKSLMYLVCKQKQTDLLDKNTFVNDALNEILPQIQDPNQKKLFVFSQEIPAEFKLDLIVSLLIISDLTEQIVSDFYPFILSQNNENFYFNQRSKIQFLLKKIIKSGFIDMIYQFIFANSNLYSVISIDNCHLYLNSFSDEMFIEKFQQIESFYLKAPELNREFILILLKKCQIHHLKLKSIEKIFNYILPDDLTSDIIGFLKNYEFVLSSDVAMKFIGISDFSFLLKIIPNIDIIPEKLHEKILLNSNDLDFYDRVTQSSSSKSHIFNSSKFYIHIFDIIKEQKDNKNSTNLIKKIAAVFQNCVEDKNFNKIMDEIIFSRYPPNNEFTSFLTIFINSFNRYHLDLYNNPGHMSLIINKILQEGVIPSTSFLRLICGDSIMKIMNDMQLRSLKLNHIHYYCYHFSNKTNKYGGFPKILPIPPLKSIDDQILIDFIANNNFDLLKNLNEDAFLLVINALIFSEDDNMKYINGLTKDNILPFCAISWKNWKRKSSQNKKNTNLFQNDLMQKLFMDSFKNAANSESCLIKSSINSILSTDMKSPIFNSLQMKKDIIANLINLLLNNEYHADKTVLFAFLFCNSNLFRDIKMNSKDLFRCFIQHLHEIDYESIKYKINFNFLNSSYEITKLFIDIIENKNSSKSDVINCVNFIMNFCYNIKGIKINNIENLVEIVKCEKDNHIAALISKFNRYFRITQLIPNISATITPNKIENCLISDMKNELDDTLYSILSDSCIEKNDVLIDDLFKLMIKNKSLYKEYLQILFHNLDYYSEIDPFRLISLYSNEYHDDNETFIQSLNLVRICHPKNLVFIKRAKTNECKYILSENEKSIIDILFNSIKQKPGNYQSFFCLNSIALTFPFLLESFTEQILNLVLPEIDNFSLIFEDDENEDREMKVKTSIAAFSFLISALHSNKIIDSFFVWFFNNISTFSDSAIFCFNCILYTAIMTEKIKVLVMSYLLEYKYIDFIQVMMEREIQNNIFKTNYMKMIYLLLNQYYESINNFKSIDCAIMSHFLNSKNRFYIYFDRQTTFLPFKILQIKNDLFLNIPDCQVNKNIASFIDDITRPRNFWINYKRNVKSYQMIDQSKVDDFFSKYNCMTKYENKRKFTFEKKEINHSTITVEMVNYLLDNEKWIFKYIYENKDFPILNEHYNALLKSVDDLKRIEQKSTKKINEVDVDNYFQNQYNQFDLFKSLIGKINSPFNNEIFVNLRQTLEAISKRKDILKSIITYIDNNIDEIINKEAKGENSYNLLNNNLSLLLNISKSNEFQHHFLEICCSKIINLCLNPQYRLKYIIMNKLSNILLNITDKKLPIQATQMISFILITSYDKDLLLALKLYSKFTFDEVDHITIIQVLFKKELEKQEISKNNIYQFLKHIPSLLKSYHLELISLLDKYLDKVNLNETDNASERFAFFLLKSLLPKRDYRISFIFDETTNLIPGKLVELDKEFWQIFEKYRSTIDRILKKQINDFIKSKDDAKKRFGNINGFFLFKEYPELFSFELRLQLFDSMVKRERIKKRFLVLRIDQKNIIESSFNELNHLPNNEWNKLIQIIYINEKGQDIGGLRRDWFTKITRELLNPNYGLFVSSECMKYKPSCKSYIIPNHLEYFKFTGKIVARALLQRENVNAHFAHSFLNHILQIPISLKDIEYSDLELFNSYNQFLESDIQEDEYYFEVCKDDNGTYKTIELKENGSNISVTNQNKHEYIELLVDFNSRQSISDQIEKFCEGFYSIIPLEFIQIFTPTELDLLICGKSEIDVEDMKNNAEIIYPYTKNTLCVKLFFEAIKKWSQNDLQKLLVFFTGSPNPPVTGFKYYKEIGKPFCIEPGGGPERLPCAHTCAYTIDLPQYRTEEELNHKFREAIEVEIFLLE